MNLILFDSGEFPQPLPISDSRARHLINVLKCSPGEVFDAGIINGPRGKGQIRRVTNTCLELDFEATHPPSDPEPITLLVGLPRPQTARKILREVASLGVGRIHFILTSRGDPSYARSTLWTSGEARRHLVAGTEQAFSTRLPEFTHGQTLDRALAGLDEGSSRFALDNYEADEALMTCPLRGFQAVLAVGAERGWVGSERAALRNGGFQLVHLGERVLRTETAVVSGLAIVRGRLGL